MASPSLVSTAAAATRLGVKRATLYAYVSRGRLQAFRLPGRAGSWFDPLQLDALAGRARAPEERRPDLRITSRITLVERGQFWYRGQAPVTLARTEAFEQVAERLWHGGFDPLPHWRAASGAIAAARRVLRSLPAGASPTDQLRVVVAVLGVADPLRVDLRPAGVQATARRLMAGALGAVSNRVHGPVAAQVAAWVGLAPASAVRLAALDDVLVLMADHELAASTLAVRVAASFGADPYAAVAAGLGAMSGARHGAASRRLEEALAAMARRVPPMQAAGNLFAGPDAAAPGFGHPLYPAGDPRVLPIMRLARRLGSSSRAGTLLALAQSQGLPPPNVDFALAAFSHALGVAPGAGEAIFGAARLAGWLAHAMEEYAARTDFRLRAVYTGERPV